MDVFCCRIALPKVRDDFDAGFLNSLRSSRLIIFLGFLLGFTCVLAAIWIMFQDYVAFKGRKYSNTVAALGIKVACRLI